MCPDTHRLSSVSAVIRPGRSASPAPNREDAGHQGKSLESVERKVLNRIALLMAESVALATAVPADSPSNPRFAMIANAPDTRSRLCPKRKADDATCFIASPIP